MGLFDDLLVGGAGLAFVEHEHTKHNRQRFEQQAYLQQQQQQNAMVGRQYQSPPPQQQGGYGARDMYAGGYPAGGVAAAVPPCAFCPNCGFNLQAAAQQQQQRPGQ